MNLQLPNDIPMTALQQFAEAHGCVLHHRNKGELEMIKQGTVSTAPITYTLERAAKMLGIGSKTLYQRLRDENIIDRMNLAYQRHIDSGHMRNEMRYRQSPTGQRPYAVALVTVKGLQWLRDKFQGCDD